ncbi:uncharacterized protein LOC132609432 [Lycium barbarum]|uniref:uncharacterized protein LOC132609432 n=1 Tax=Lycium barbarum TaxID=112863 RepID=UPI00293E77CA|nr:uncharacterized protein LOC132609432 [Lycium barbarum]
MTEGTSLPMINMGDETERVAQQESAIAEENRILRQQMIEMLQGWSNGQQPPQSIPGFPDITSATQACSQAPLSTAEDPVYPPGFGHYTNLPNTAETSVGRPSRVPIRTDHFGITTTGPAYTCPLSNPNHVANVRPVYTIPPPAVMQRSNLVPPSDIPQEQHFTPDFAFGAPDPYHQTLHFSPLIDSEGPAKNAVTHLGHEYGGPAKNAVMHLGSEYGVATKNVEHDEMVRKMKSLEQAMKNLQGSGSYKSVSYSDLCMFPSVHLPPGFKTPKFDKYDGYGDPIAHLRRYCNQLRGAGGNQDMLMAYFGESLTGLASEWFIDQDIVKWHTWDDMANEFVQQFQYNIDLVPDKKSLTNLKKKVTESFREFAVRWREQAARVKPPMREREMVETFLQAQDETYYQHMIPAVGKPFIEAIKMGEIIEEGIKTGRIVGFAALKATTQAIQNGLGSFGGKKKKEVKLRALNVLSPIEGRIPNPPPKNLDYSQRCAYCSDTPGHNIEKCWYLKKAIQDLIDTQQIVVQNADIPNINQNPLPNHKETNMLELIYGSDGSDVPYKPIMKIEAGVEKSVNVADSAKTAPLGLNEVTKRPIQSDTMKPLLIVKGAPEKVGTSQGKPKLIVPGVSNRPILTVKGAFTTPIIIKPVTKLSIVDAKAIPWNYNQTMVTYQGKEIIKEVDEVGGLTRSGRCFAPEELRKTKQVREGQIPVKKPVTEEEAEEFLKKMKLPDYSIVEQLRKTPAQISLLSLLIHSDEHRKALLKILNEAHVPTEITVNQLEKIAGRIFEVNRITFSDDELPIEVKTDAIGEIDLVLTIGPADFTIDFQVLNINASYNMLLGRPWVHMAGAIPSTLHQMIKFEYDRQEVIVHGEGDLSIYKDSTVPFIEVDNVDETLVYQASEIVVAEQIPEGKPILRPQLPPTSVMVVNEMLKYGFDPGKGLRASLQGMVYPVCPRESPGPFGLGFKPTAEDRKRVKKRKKEAWSLTKPVPPIYKSFVKNTSSFSQPVLDVDFGLIGCFQNLFVEADMVEIGGGPSNADVQFIGHDVQLSNWEVTPLPTRKEFCSVCAGSNDMTCMRNSQPDLKIRPNHETMNQEVEYDEEEVFQEIKLIQALFKYKDVFAWSYDDMSGLSTKLVVHKLPTDPTFPPVKQKLRKLKSDMSVKVKEEIEKQLEAKVIRVARYPTWLSNVVPVPKKDGKTRVCVDYRDLNKASPKDDFPLPNIHILLDNCAKHEIASFVDCYAGYHQIVMDDDDAEKTSFITEWGTYCYRVMLFGLKNAGATYMRAMTTIFHDMMHKEIEVYVDDVIIKSRKQSDHVKDLVKFFERLRRYNLKLNPAKCIFGVPSGKLLGFVVSRRGIELDPAKIKAIQELPPPKNKTEVMSLLGRLNYISRFIAQLTTTCEPIFKLLKKNAVIEWTDECQEAFDKIKRYLSNPPVLVPPEPGRPLILYLSVLDNSFGCVLGQHDVTGKKEQAIYYLSKKFTTYEAKYTHLERTCCALTWVAQKLKHYLSSYTTYLISRLDPLKYIFQKPMPTGRLAKWQILLTEFDISYVTRTAMKAQALADHLAENPVDEEYEPLKTHFPDEEVSCLEEVILDNDPGWKLFFDGALRFYYTNNMAKYEACILGLRLAIDMGIQELLVLGDSDLLVHQVQGEWETRDLKLIPYHQCLQDLCRRFITVKFKHIPRIHNEIADALATLSSMLPHPDKAHIDPLHIQTHNQHAYCNTVEEELDGEPWFHDIKEYIESAKYPAHATSDQKRAIQRLASGFFLSGGILYKKTPDLGLLRCVDAKEAATIMTEIHSGVCGPHMNGYVLAKKILRAGYYWLTMERDSIRFVRRCHQCQVHGDLIHSPPSELHTMSAPWPFAAWGMDVIGPIEPKVSNGHRFILVAIDYFTKWVEAATLKSVTKKAVVDFVHSNIICRFGIPRTMISDNAANLNSHLMREVCQQFKITHRNSTPYRPKANGAVEAANKNIKKILRKMVQCSRQWHAKLPFALLGYRTTVRTSVGATPYLLVYGTEAVIPAEVEIPSLRIIEEAGIDDNEWVKTRLEQLSLIDEKRLTLVCHGQLYQRRIARAHNKKVRHKHFEVGQLVLKRILPHQAEAKGKFAPNWQGPFVVKKVLPKGALYLTDIEGTMSETAINADAVKRYYV